MPAYLSIDQARAIIRKAIQYGTTHRDYKRVVELADKYEKLITGEDQDDLLRQFTKREDEELFEQRKLITQPITSAMAASLMNPFQKVGRTDPIVKRIQSDNEKAVEEIEDRVRYFYESENESDGLDFWLQTRYFELLFTDPNSFVVVEFEAFDANKEKAYFYPYEVPAVQAINFEFQNNDLKWLLDRKPITYQTKESDKEGFKYTLYVDEFAIAYTRVDSSAPEFKAINNGLELEEIDGKGEYVVEIFDYKLNTTPAVRVGYTRDLKTKGRTCVNPFHAAMPYFMKSIKTVSEFDLTMALHAFPQKYQYVDKCHGLGNKGCKNGVDLKGDTCGSCGGTGYAIHTSAQDAVLLPMPNDPEDMIDINKLSTYKYPPIELVKFQDEIIDKFESKAHKAVFNSQALVKKGIVSTATEMDLNMDSVYDALHLYADKISSVWLSIVDLIAVGTDNEKDLILVHRYPSDFKFKSIGELVNELKFANESGAPSLVREKLNDDIADQTFQDDPSGLVAYNVKKRFSPFPGKTETEILFLMNSQYTRLFDKVLYANFEAIFQKLDWGNDFFFEKKYEEQKNLIAQEVEAIVTQINESTVERFNAEI